LAVKRHEVVALLSTREEEIHRRFGVRSLRLFGSVARDEASATSDVDVSVDFREPPTFRAYMDLRIFLEDLLGARVDLVTETGLRSRVRPFVERDAIRVA
jgi:uncharacterized protein